MVTTRAEPVEVSFLFWLEVFGLSYILRIPSASMHFIVSKSGSLSCPG